MALTPSQRVALIKEIASRLSSENWSFIDLTLEEFGLSTGSWSGSASGYVVAMLKGAGDQALLDLAQHSGFSFQGDVKPQGIDPPFWQAGMLRLFVSHLAAYRDEAAQLQSALLRYGISCFVAHNDIKPTDEWLAQIETALSTCDALLALMHPNFHDSQWTDQEIGFGMGRGVPILAVQQGQLPYGFVGRFQAFSGQGKPPQILAGEIFRALLQHKQTQQRMSDVAITMFELSASFQEAKDRMSVIQEIIFWEPSFSVRVLAAAKNNGQISEAYGVPDRVHALVKKRTPEVYQAQQAQELGFDPDEIPF